MLTCIVLASGASRRFGSQKLLQPLHTGETMLRTSVKNYCQVYGKVLVVISNGKGDSESIKKGLQGLPITLIENDRSDLGMSESIKIGITAAPAHSDYLIALGDMPYIANETLEHLKTKLIEPTSTPFIVAPYFEGQQGNPVGFSNSFKEQLLLLHGDVGAKALLEKHKSYIKKITCKDRGIITDIDTPDALKEAENYVISTPFQKAT